MKQKRTILNEIIHKVYRMDLTEIRKYPKTYDEVNKIINFVFKET